jgi:hypothetical protein
MSVATKWGNGTISIDVSEEGLAQLIKGKLQYATLLEAALGIRMPSGELLHAFEVIEPHLYRKLSNNKEVLSNDDPELLADITDRFEVLMAHYDGVPKPYNSEPDGVKVMADPLIDCSGVKREMIPFTSFMREKAFETKANGEFMNLHEIWAAYRTQIRSRFPSIS